MEATNFPKHGDIALHGLAAELGSDLSKEAIEEAISKSINDNSPDLGLKAIVDSQRRKFLSARLIWTSHLRTSFIKCFYTTMFFILSGQSIP